MNQHTPGPWTLCDAHLQNEETGDEFPIITAWDEKGECSVAIATCCPDADEMYANARLIASAPDLLAALKDMESEYQMLYAEAFTDKPDRILISSMATRVFGKLRAAIHRAEHGG